MDNLLDRLVVSYHDVANELSDLINAWNGEEGLPPDLDREVRKIRDSMDALYDETISDFQRAAVSARTDNG